MKKLLALTAAAAVAITVFGMENSTDKKTCTNACDKAATEKAACCKADKSCSKDAACKTADKAKCGTKTNCTEKAACSVEKAEE